VAKKKYKQMKKTVIICLLAILPFINRNLFAQLENLKLHYTFERLEDGKVKDISGNGYDAIPVNNAYLDKIGDYNILNLGYNNGYINMASAGELIATLNANFSISIYVYVKNNADLSANGNFLWTFANSGNIEADNNGNMFFSVKQQRYAITQTNYSAEQGVQTGTALTKGVWKHITLVQNANTATIYIDGVQRQSGAVSKKPSLLGATTNNFIGRSCYSGDVYLNALVADFRIYNTALSQEEIAGLAASLPEMNVAMSDYIEQPARFVAGGNPLFTHKYTADPAAMVWNDTLWIFCGEDFAGGQTNYVMKNWCAFSTPDMKNYLEYPVPLYGANFSWSTKQAYAGHVAEKNGVFYFYVSTNTSGIGVARAMRPEGPYTDALGHALLTNANCPGTTHSWACIDPAVFIDDDGQAYIFWGNGQCYYAKLNDDMISINGAVHPINFDGLVFEEAPYIHKHNGKYYLTYASGFPEKIGYAMADRIEGPWQYKGILNEIAGNSNTNHQAIVDYKGRSYFIYHNGARQRQGGSFSRSVCVDYLYYNADGTMQRVQMTSEGVEAIEGEDNSIIVVAPQNNSPVKIYPNPASQTLHIAWDELKDKSLLVSIFDVNGKKALAKTLHLSQNEVNISNIPSGAYIIECSNTKDFRDTAKLIIQK
jgi:hypothetical protein